MWWEIGTFLTWQGPLRIVQSRQDPTSSLRSCVTLDTQLRYRTHISTCSSGSLVHTGVREMKRNAPSMPAIPILFQLTLKTTTNLTNNGKWQRPYASSFPNQFVGTFSLILTPSYDIYTTVLPVAWVRRLGLREEK